MTKTAHLRVYVPDPDYSSDPVPGFVRSYGLLSERESDANWVAEWDGEIMVCPRNLRLRVLESTVAFANAFRGLGSGLIPEAAAEAASSELKAYHREHPAHKSQVMTSAWHVPVRWFSLFDPSEREVYHVGDHPRLRFRTSMVDAQIRLARVLGVLKPLPMFQGPMVELNQLSEWLEQFSGESMVELDYSSVSDLFEPSDLVLDDSVELIQTSVDALAEGDMMAAGEKYGRVVTRWAPAYSVTFSN